MMRITEQKFKPKNTFQFLLMLALTCIFFSSMVLPLFSLFIKAFLNDSGDFIGLGNYLEYFKQPALFGSVLNTLNISLKTSIVSTALGMLYAYALRRTNIRWKRFFQYAALFPIFVPTVVHGIGFDRSFWQSGHNYSDGPEI